jgi:hypothetical protein
MRKLPPALAPYAFGVIQAAVTTCVATAVATAQIMDVGPGFWGYWLAAWIFSWLTMLPIVILVAPVIRRIVQSMTGPPIA